MPAPKSPNIRDLGGTQTSGEILIHATCVASGPSGLLIIGASGSGKSSVALQMMALGAELVADDRTTLRLDQGVLIASAPPHLRGLIEARGVGLLQAEARCCTPVSAVLDMDRDEPDRLPIKRDIRIMEQTLPLLHKAESPHFCAALLQYLKGGWRHL